MRPRIGIVPGDPSGIGPELIAKLVADETVLDQADLLLIGDTHLWKNGAKQANLSLELATICEETISEFTGIAHLDQKRCRLQK